jgi:hypothetical protein
MKSERSGHLRRVLGVGFGLAVSIGGTIGVGILRTPGLVAEQLHAPVSIGFVVGCGRHIHTAWRELFNGVGRHAPASRRVLRLRAPRFWQHSWICRGMD